MGTNDKRIKNLKTIENILKACKSDMKNRINSGRLYGQIAFVTGITKSKFREYLQVFIDAEMIQLTEEDEIVITF